MIYGLEEPDLDELMFQAKQCPKCGGLGRLMFTTYDRPPGVVQTVCDECYMLRCEIHERIMAWNRKALAGSAEAPTAFILP